MYQCETAGMQDVMQMCGSFDANKSTKGASKLRRDLINGEIANLRDLLPLPSSTRQRLSQLQLMALVCVYVRKANYFQQVFKRFHELGHPYCTPNIGFSKALSGFLIMMTQNGKLLYISDNAAEYLGHSMEDLLIHGDSVYDIIDKSDHGTVQSELLRSTNMQNPPGEETRVFLCRMNVSRNARRQMRFGDQKVVLLQGHFLSFLPLCSRNEPVFVATCTPVAMPETRECVVQGATNIFTTIHAMDMKFMHIDRNAEYYLGYTRSEIGGTSWYRFIHWSYMREAQNKHRLISQSEQEKSCILLLRLQKRNGDWIWVHCVLQVKDGSDSNSSSSAAAVAANSSTGQTQQSVIVATNQILSEREAAVMRVNAWLYHYYTVQTKLQYGLAYQDAAGMAGSTLSPSAATRFAAAAAYFPSTQLLSYGSHLHHPQTHQYANASGNGTTMSHHQTSPESNSIGSTGVSSGYGTSTIQSPHSISSYPSSGHYHSYHSHPHSHAYETNGSSITTATKESPLDFSLAASSMYEYQMGNVGYSAPGATSSYWVTPNQHSHYPYGADSASANHRVTNHVTAAEDNSSIQKQSTTIWPIPSSLTSPPSSSSSSGQNSASQKHQRKSGTSKTKYSAMFPPDTNSQPTHGNANGKTKTSSNAGESNPKKKKKHSKAAHHSAEVLVGESSPSQENNSRSSAASRNSSTRFMPESTSNPCTPSTSHTRGGTLVSTVSPYSYHIHSRRTLHKMFGSSGEHDELDGSEQCAVSSKSSLRSHSHQPLALKEEGMTIAAWPLTPSPIWEGQSHRVPDMQQFYGDLRESHHAHSHHYNSLHHSHGLMMSSPAGTNGTESYSVSGGLDHSIVPSATSTAVVAAAAAAYHHQQNSIVNTAYLHQFYNSSATGAMMMMTPGIATATGIHPSSANGAGLLTFGIGSGSSTNNGHTGSLSIESGSPNKENRLPPTPESDPGEHEETRPSAKWENL